MGRSVLRLEGRSLALSADSTDIGGNLNASIGDRGGTIDGNALLNFNVTQDITIQGDAAWQILNDSGTNMNAASPIGEQFMEPPISCLVRLILPSPRVLWSWIFSTKTVE